MGDNREREPLLNSESNRNATNGAHKQNIVSWDEEGDPENPYEWSKKYRWFCCALLCLLAAVVTYTCIGIVPVAGDVVKELKGHKDREAAVLFVTIWELGEATGPLFIAPLSELFGRFVVYNIANCLFITGIVMTALSQELGLLIFARFLTGCAVAANVLNPAIVGDMFPSESRGAAMSAVMLAPLIGGALGPTISGSLAEATGWREIMWLCVGLAVLMEIVMLTTFRETYGPTILRRRAAKKRQETGDESWTTKFDQQDKTSGWLMLRQGMTRPIKIIYSSSLLQCLSLWGGLAFSFFYVNSTSLPEILEVMYGFGPGARGRSYLAWSAGSCLGIITCNRGMDLIYNKLAKRKDFFYPEGRLPLCIFGAFFLPVAVTLYGGSGGAQWPVWIFLITVGMLSISVVCSYVKRSSDLTNPAEDLLTGARIVPMMTYITDSFGNYSASAMTAVLITRCLMGAFLPLTVPPLADKVGYGPAFLVLGSAALLLAPIPVFIMRYGPTWRQGSSYTKDSDE